MGSKRYANGPHLGIETADVLRALARLDVAQGRLDIVDGLYRRAEAAIEGTLGPKHVGLAEVLEEHAKLLHQMNRQDDAARAEARATKIRKQANNSPRP